MAVVIVAVDVGGSGVNSSYNSNSSAVVDVIVVESMSGEKCPLQAELHWVLIGKHIECLILFVYTCTVCKYGWCV